MANIELKDSSELHTNVKKYVKERVRRADDTEATKPLWYLIGGTLMVTIITFIVVLILLYSTNELLENIDSACFILFGCSLATIGLLLVHSAYGERICDYDVMQRMMKCGEYKYHLGKITQVGDDNLYVDNIPCKPIAHADTKAGIGTNCIVLAVGHKFYATNINYVAKYVR